LRHGSMGAAPFLGTEDCHSTCQSVHPGPACDGDARKQSAATRGGWDYA
jgi:hypothetical protein